jgi:predicted CoA-binding protein
MPQANPPDDQLSQLLNQSSVVAMVGASDNPDKASYGIMQKLQSVGYRVIPVNPRATEILGEKSYGSLLDIPDKVDIVDVFRKSEDTPAIADDAVKIGAKALWLQTGITNDDAAARAGKGGLLVVMDECIGFTVSRLKAKPKAQQLH